MMVITNISWIWVFFFSEHPLRTWNLNSTCSLYSLFFFSFRNCLDALLWCNEDGVSFCLCKSCYASATSIKFWSCSACSSFVFSRIVSQMYLVSWFFCRLTSEASRFFLMILILYSSYSLSNFCNYYSFSNSLWRSISIYFRTFACLATSVYLMQSAISSSRFLSIALIFNRLSSSFYEQPWCLLLHYIFACLPLTNSTSETNYCSRWMKSICFLCLSCNLSSFLLSLSMISSRFGDEEYLEDSVFNSKQTAASKIKLPSFLLPLRCCSS